MITRCPKCLMYFEDNHRYTFCPHKAMPADEIIIRVTHNDAWLALMPPEKWEEEDLE